MTFNLTVALAPTLIYAGTIAAPESDGRLSAKGWTLRPAAEVLGVHWTHLHKVLSGTRHSASLLRRVATLPNRQPQPAARLLSDH